MGGGGGVLNWGSSEILQNRAFGVTSARKSWHTKLHIAKFGIIEKNSPTIGAQYTTIQNFYSPLLTEFRYMG